MDDEMDAEKRLLREHFLDMLSSSSRIRARSTMLLYAKLLATVFLTLKDRLGRQPDPTWWNTEHKDVVDATENRLLTAGTKSNVYCALIALLDAPGTQAYDVYSAKLKEHNETERNNMEEQKLDGKEVDNWPSFPDIVANKNTLEPFTREWFFYTLLLDMRDTCLFRRDILYNTYLHDGPAEGHILKNNPPRLFIGHHKTSRTHGRRNFSLPPQFSDYINKTFGHLRPGDKVFTDNERTASHFVKSSWKLDDRNMTMNYLRSSLATRFINTHPTYKQRAQFATNSGTSMYVLHAAYDKWERAHEQVSE